MRFWLSCCLVNNEMNRGGSWARQETFAGAACLDRANQQTWGFEKKRANRVRVEAAPLQGADRVGLASEAALHGCDKSGGRTPVRDRLDFSEDGPRSGFRGRHEF